MAFNKFLDFSIGESNVTDGSININGRTLTAVNLDPSRALRTDAIGVIISSELNISDTNGLQTSLNSRVIGPASAVDENICVYDGTTGKLIKDSGTNLTQITTGPVSATDEAFCRFDGTTGKIIQNSVLTADDSGHISKSGTNYIHTKGGDSNFFSGSGAGNNAALLSRSTAVGVNAMFTNPNATQCSAMGHQSQELATGISLNSFGVESLQKNTGGSNEAFGTRALKNSTSTFECCAYGHDSLGQLLDGDSISAFGFASGFNYTGSETDNICISNRGVVGDNNKIRIGSSPEHTNCFIQGIHNVTPAGSTEVVMIDSSGEMGSTDSPTVSSVNLTEDANGNTFYGFLSLNAISTGSFNSIYGHTAGSTLTTQNECSFFGWEAGQNAASFRLTGIGAQCLQNCTSPDSTGIGRGCLRDLTTGSANTCGGQLNAAQLTSGSENTCFGFQCLLNPLTASRNVVVGYLSQGLGGTTQTDNCCLGHRSGYRAHGNDLVAIGSGSLNTSGDLTGSNIIAIGKSAGSSLSTTDADNILIGNTGTAGDSGVIKIGNNTDHNRTETINADYPPGYINGLIIADATVSTKTISAGECRSDDDSWNIINSGTLTPNITSSGANGLDTGSEASDTWYAIYVIADSTGVNSTASLLSVSSSSPTMPSGYDKKRRVGWVRNDGSSNFYDYYTTSKGRDRTYYWREDIDNVLNAGSATSRTAVDFSEWLPPTCREAYIGCGYFGSPADEHMTLYPNATDFTADNSPWQVFSGATVHSQDIWIPCNSSQNIYYENSSSFDSAFLSQLGFIDSI